MRAGSPGGSNTLARMRPRLAALLVPLALVAGCGGSHDKGSTRAAAAPTPAGAAPADRAPATSPAPAAKKRFIKQADKLCRAGRAKLLPLRTGLAKVSQSQDPDVVFKRYAALTSQAAGVYGQILGQIRGLRAPPADQAEVDRLLGLLGQTASIERQISSAAAAQDASRIKQLNVQARTTADRFRAGAKAYGFHDCARPPGQALERRGNR